MKNLKIFLFSIFALVLFSASKVDAVSLNGTNFLIDDPILVTSLNVTGGLIHIYQYSGGIFNIISDSYIGLNVNNGTFETGNSYYVVELNENSICYNYNAELSYQDCVDDGNILSSKLINIVEEKNIASLGIFFTHSQDTGFENSANSLIANVGSATGTTFKSMSPIFAIVIGIILAFVVLFFIINTVKQTDEKTKNKI